MTVDEFRRFPEDSGPVYHELRHGEVVAVTRPKLKHSLVQGNLRQLLNMFAEPGSYAEIEVAYRPLPEHELWVADVAYISAERFQQTDPEDNPHATLRQRSTTKSASPSPTGRGNSGWSIWTAAR